MVDTESADRDRDGETCQNVLLLRIARKSPTGPPSYIQYRHRTGREIFKYNQLRYITHM